MKIILFIAIIKPNEGKCGEIMKIAALDIGGTSMKAGLVEDGRLSDFREVDTCASRGGEMVMRTAEEIISSFSSFDRIGISTAGQVDSREGVIRFANENIPRYTGMAVRARMENKFRVPVAVENDVNAAAVGEARFGAGRGYPDFLCLTYGTGIGGAIVLDQRIYAGHAYSAGEFGHIVTHAEGRPCNCGLRGCYERYASVTALVNAAKELDPSLNSGRAVFRRMDDPAVKKVVDGWIGEILIGLATLIHIFNPACIVLGGGIMNEEYITGELSRRLPGHIMPSYADVALRHAELRNEAGLLGAASLAAEL